MSKSAKPIVAANAPEAEPPKYAQWCLALICFLAGAAIMVIEISAYRLLAPTFGNSAFTWTALIGVILIAFSAGGYLGGWLAEKKSDFALLGWLLAGASVLTMFVPLINHTLAPSFERTGLIAGPLAISIFLFLLPGVLLGAVSPASVRLYSLLGKDAHVGFAAGTISMLGSLGSFVGTLLSGFYLLSHFGVKSIFLGTGLVLLVMSALAFLLARRPLKGEVPSWLLSLLPIWMASLLAGSLSLATEDKAVANVIYEHDSYYHRIQVLEQGIDPHNERYLHLDSTIEGGMRMRDGGLLLNYQQFWQLPLMKPGFELNRALYIGAGAFGMPERMSMQYPKAKIDVAEIDPSVIETGRKFFKLDQFPQVQAHAGDARRFLKQSTEAKYDFIFGDAYNGIRQIPVHLASKEFFQLVHDRLTPHGIFVMNVISAVQGPRAELLAGMMKTLQEVFPHLELFAVGGGLESIQNVILLASKDSWTPLFTESSYVPGSEFDSLARAFVPPNRWPTGGVVFTDDLNPVDAIVARGLMLQ